MENQSTPNGWVCTLLTHNSTMSSSEMEEASSGVPSPLIIETTSNLSCNESGDGTSQSRDTVAEEVTDISGEIYLLDFTY